MSSLARIALFAAALALVAGAAAALGYAVGPLERGEDEVTEGHGGMETEALSLQLVPSPSFAFRIPGVDRFDVTHERRMHLILVRRDLTGFRHLHPRRGADGAWTVKLPALAPGVYRAFADFTTGGEKRVLSTDVVVPGAPRSLPLPHADVRLRPAPLTAGVEQTLAFETPLALGRYLGARGHLVVLRASDLDYLHVHADEDALRFATTFPSAGRYRAFLQFRADGRVRTAAFDLDVQK